MKSIKVVLDILLILIFIGNLFFVGIHVLYGYGEGIFYYVLFDRPEFSHLNEGLLQFINIATSLIMVVAALLPLGIKLLPQLSPSLKRKWIGIISVIPLSLIVIKFLAFPEPHSYLQTSKGKYLFRQYEWKSKNKVVVKSWISEKPSNAYGYQERIKWLPFSDENEKN